MNRLTIAPSKDRLLSGGKEWFWLADTVWSVFTNATTEEWAEYLKRRASQGFNTVQINILPQWDRSISRLSGPEPFEPAADGSYDFDKPVSAYFDHVEAMVAQAVNAGMRPALVLLWANYIPGNWCSKKVGCATFRPDQIDPYIRYVVGRLAKFEPVLIISGDTDFPTPEVIECYGLALLAAKSAAPHLLTTFHISGMHDAIPDALASSKCLDFYMYQSCHCLASAPMPYELAQRFREKPVTRPIVNGEPCYEGIKCFDGFYRFTALDVRRASWQSVLAGASVGITYGAHGIWGWQTTDDSTCAEYVQLNNRPYQWRIAMGFRGADDVALIKSTIESRNLFGLRPTEWVTLKEPSIRCAALPDESAFAVYSPCATDLPMTIALADYKLTIIDLETRHELPVSLDASGKSVIAPHINSDFVLLGQRR